MRSLKKIPLLTLYLTFCVMILASCGWSCGPADIKGPGAEADFSVPGFEAMINFSEDKHKEGMVCLGLNYADAMEGFVIPDSMKDGEAFFKYRFEIINSSAVPGKYHYMIYYQNESYKFPEYVISGDGFSQHPYAHENFYGSWEDTGEGMRVSGQIPADGRAHEVTGQFRITGNPRNETRYMAGGQNDRWKRNPRVGKYRFLLVVCSEKDTALFPDELKDISLLRDSSFVNPFYYFLKGPGSEKPGLITLFSSDSLKVSASPPLNAGIWADPLDFPGPGAENTHRKDCGHREDLYMNAGIKQFIHYVDSSSTFDNIPLIADVTHDFYSLTDYNWNHVFTAADEKIRIKPATVDCPCSELQTDSMKGSIRMLNRASEWGKWKKQNVGIITRHGLTYGTYTVKVKLPELLNRYGMWNGLTNAVWLITQSGEAWNNRRACDKEGYILNYYGDGKSQRGRYSSYSEIDFEILKTSAYCPEYVYPPVQPKGVADPARISAWNLPYPEDPTVKRDEIMVCCTNWDMACPSPPDYGIGCQQTHYQGLIFQPHRWDHWYKAITSKTPAKDDELFGGPYFYFQIIWKPEEIVWRIGPEKASLRTVGYMNAGMTSIPDNQMLLIISQEFHSTNWWHGSPFPQGSIPFAARDITGEVFEITIE